MERWCRKYGDYGGGFLVRERNFRALQFTSLKWQSNNNYYREEPEPDQSWMKTKLPRKSFYEWFPKTLK
jgi:hypothetical protein